MHDKKIPTILNILYTHPIPTYINSLKMILITQNKPQNLTVDFAEKTNSCVSFFSKQLTLNTLNLGC